MGLEECGSEDRCPNAVNKTMNKTEIISAFTGKVLNDLLLISIYCPSIQ